MFNSLSLIIYYGLQLNILDPLQFYDLPKLIVVTTYSILFILSNYLLSIDIIRLITSYIVKLIVLLLNNTDIWLPMLGFLANTINLSTFVFLFFLFYFYIFEFNNLHHFVTINIILLLTTLIN